MWVQVRRTDWTLHQERQRTVTLSHAITSRYQKTPSFEPLKLKMIVLSRQARDKHREELNKEAVSVGLVG
eukprot:COSAG06_NODE_295_length_18175_cov_9.088017_22_plen_70_part_00